MKNDLYNPLVVKFIRFYPVTFSGNKALRVEVFGSKQGKLSSLCEQNVNDKAVHGVILGIFHGWPSYNNF